MQVLVSIWRQVSSKFARLVADYIDRGHGTVVMGYGHADLLSVQAMLKDAGFQVPEVNMEAYMKVRALIQEFMDDFSVCISVQRTA